MDYSWVFISIEPENEDYYFYLSKDKIVKKRSITTSNDKSDKGNESNPTPTQDIDSQEDSDAKPGTAIKIKIRNIMSLS